MLKIRNLASGYGKIKVLKNVSMHVDPGEIVTIIGANGAGKTTLLSTIAGLVKANSGEAEFKKTNILKAKAADIPGLGCVMVPEGRQVFATMTVEENLLLGGHVVQKQGKLFLNQLMEHQYELFPILRDRKYQLAGTLSGGEQQMLAISRALMARPRVLLLDEPSLGLAPLIIKQIFEIIRKINKESNTTIFLVEQNANQALKLADRGYVMENGCISLVDSAENLLTNDDVRKAYLGI
jgi:branched-chain amino acid transport system ATP-binding protein